MNSFITSAMRLYVRLVWLNPAATERITFDRLVSATYCPEKLASLVVRALLRRRILEARIGNLVIDGFNLALIELLNKVFVGEPNYLKSFEYRLVAVAQPSAQGAYWPQYETYRRASA